MKDLLEFILTNITTKPEDVSIEEVTEDGLTNYTISVNPEDVGRIIGKEGKIIKAIRSIMRVAAIQKGIRVRVSVLSDNESEPTQDSSEKNEQEVIEEEVIVESEPTPEVTESEIEESSSQDQTDSQEDSLTVEMLED